MPRQKYVVDDQKNPVAVSANTDTVFGLTPNVGLQIGSRYGNKARTARTATLTPQDARRVAIALIEAAEHVGKVSK
jgi:hypothetical protein